MIEILFVCRPTSRTRDAEVHFSEGERGAGGGEESFVWAPLPPGGAPCTGPTGYVWAPIPPVGKRHV